MYGSRSLVVKQNLKTYDLRAPPLMAATALMLAGEKMP